MILFLAETLSGCGGGPYDLSDALDRAEMINEVQNALTRGDCTTALVHSTRLYESPYTNNEIRMLYVSSQSCRAGVNMYRIFEELTSLSSANPIGEIVRIFPSTAADSKLQSAWAALDALQTVLVPGAVVGTSDRTLPNEHNPGSVLLQDLTADAQIFGFYLAMALIGTSGNRFGSPDSNYAQGGDLIWTTKSLVQADTTGSACSLAAGLLLFIDSATAIQSRLPSSAASAVGVVLNVLNGPLGPVSQGDQTCLAAVGSATTCALAKQRLRYRGACSESDAAAAYAAGMVDGFNNIWL